MSDTEENKAEEAQIEDIDKQEPMEQVTEEGNTTKEDVREEDQEEVAVEMKEETETKKAEVTESDTTESDAVEIVTVEKPKRSTELDKYWQAVKDNPSDFTGWTYLLQYVEQENNLESAREAYDAFFACYPYCYGYWKKYADMEKRHKNISEAIKVFERGVKAIPLSVELWLHYINFHITEFKAEEDSRQLYERAIATAGQDFRSDKLWNNYLMWEKDLVKLTNIYERLLETPTHLYSHHFEKFKAHILKHHPKDILPLDTFLELRQEVVKTLEKEGATEETEDAEEVPPGMEEEPSKNDAEEANKIREKILEKREDLFKKTEAEITKRWTFEEGIKRPYFHVKPLERPQLKNWREYLDFEIENGTHDRIVILFERCMIATCLYEDFWLKYAKYLEEDSVDAARSVYKRACTIHLQKKPYLHMAWAAFEERQGNTEEALTILTNLETIVKGMVMVAMRRISLERRMGNKQKTEELFQEYIDAATDAQIKSFYSIKYARYLFKVLGDEEKAKEVINTAIGKDPTNSRLYVQLLDIAYHKQPVNIDCALEVFKKILASEQLDIQTKVSMSQRRLEFLEDYGNSIFQLKECYDEHQQLLKKESQTSDKEKKRKTADPTEDIPLKKPRQTPNGNTAPPPVAQAPPPVVAPHPQPDYSAYWAHYQQQGYGTGYPGGHWGGGYTGHYGYT